MTHLKQIDRSAAVGFCPVASLLAAGTVSGAIDMSFSTNSVLEVFVLDFASNDPSPPVGGSIPVPERFNRLAWGNKPSETLPCSYGVIAGGLADGSICLWDPAAILEGNTKASMLAKMQKHTGVVRGLEFNTFSPNLLASGAADGELCIWDVANPQAPSLYPALKAGQGAASVASAEISYISWNKKVQHILASTHVDGATVVWDLKKQRPVITLKDPNSQRRCSVLQWNPDVATQLVVASDDDRTPTLQMWDLRNSMTPVKEFVGHTKGVLGMSWCQQDHSLLLSCSKDNRTICWDVNSTDVICELPASEHYNFEVQWCSTAPGVFATASFDGKVALHSLLSCTEQAAVESFNADFTVSKSSTGAAKPLKKAPNWMHRPVGATFGFGGRLVSFVNHKQPTTDPVTGQVRQQSATISISQVVTEQALVQHSEAFECAVAGGDVAALKDLCSHKAAAAAAAEDAETWTFLGVMFEDDARRQLLAKLGFSEVLAAGVGPGRSTSVGMAAAGEHLAAAAEHLRLSADGRPTLEVPAGGGEDFFTQQEDPQGFFDNLPEQPLQGTSSIPAPGVLGLVEANGDEPMTPMADGAQVAEGAEREDDIQKALFVGNYEGAVDTCFKAGRLADALLVANIGGAELFKKTMHRYMRRNPRPYMAVLTAMVDGDYMSLVKTRPVAQWRETLAVLATYTTADQWSALCDALAARLAQTGMHHAATLCYICAGNVDQAVSYWSRAVRTAAPGGPPVELLQSVIEKSVVLGMATHSGGASPHLADLITTYATSLATQGRMATALRYLGMVPGEAGTSVAVLKDRIYRSGAPGIPPDVPAPPFPFQLEDVRPVAPTSPTAAGTPVAAYSNAYGGAAAGGSAAAGGYGYQQPAAAAGYRPPSTQQAYPSYGASTPGGSAYGASAGYGGYGAQAGGYGQPAAAAPAAGYGAAAAAPAAYGAAAAQPTGYGAAAAQPGYGAPAAYDNGSAYKQPGQQQAGYGAAAAASAYQPQQPAAAGYGAGGYAAAPPAQSSMPMYQPKKATPAPAAAPPPQPTFTPSVPAAPLQPQHSGGAYAPQGPAAGPMPGAYAPAAPVAAAAAAPPPQVAQPQAFFTPTTSTSIAQAPLSTGGRPGAVPGAAGGYGGYGAPPPGAPGMPGAAAPAAAAAAAQPAAPPPPAGPPAHITMQTAEVAKVPAEQRPILNSLNNLFNACLPLANNPARKREMDDNSKRLGGLFWKLNEGQVSQHVVAKLLQMCAALDAGNWAAAGHVQVELTTSDWDECGTWLTALKRLIKIRALTG